MERNFKPMMGSVILENEKLSIINAQETITLSLGVTPLTIVNSVSPSAVQVGTISINADGHNVILNFTHTNKSDFDDLLALLKSHQARPTTKVNKHAPYFTLDYLGGHPEITVSCQLILTTEEDYIRIQNNFYSVSIPYSKMTNLSFETRSQIESRVTLTRLITFGVFALAMKKKESIDEKWFTIEFDDDIGMQHMVLFRGIQVQKAHSAAYGMYKKYTEKNTVEDRTYHEIKYIDPYEEVKKLKELLDMGIVTQEEFDIKKKELLNL